MTLRNPVVDVILSRIDNGKLPPDKTEARLQEIIDEEISRTDRSADVELIDGCLELLEKLHQPGEALPERRTPILRTVGKWVAAAAAVVLLVLGLTDNLRIHWFEHSNSVDGEQHIIIGHEVSVDVVEKAIADHGGQSSYSFTSVQEMERKLGFNPGITPELAEGWKLAGISSDFLSDAIRITAEYHTEDNPQDCITLRVQCVTDMSKAETANEPSEMGTILRISGVDVYLSQDAEGQAAQWTRGSTVFLLWGGASHADLLPHVQHLLESFAAPEDALAPVSPEQIRNSIRSNLFHKEQLNTTDFGELCDFLGFTPALFPAEALGAESVLFVAATTPIGIRVNTSYRDADDATLANFTNMYYSSTEDMIFTFEEAEEGHFVQVNGRQVYTSRNINWQNYNWNQETTISVLYSDMDEGRVLSLLSDFFAGNVMTREASRKAVADVTPDQISACISRVIARNEQLETSDFNEVCDYLGFVPAVFPAESVGADRMHFIISLTPINVIVDSIYQDEEGATLALFSNIYSLSMEDAYYIYEQNGEGYFIHIDGQQVYAYQNYDRHAYCWTQGTIVSSVHSRMDEDVILNVLIDFFAGNVMTREAQTRPVADVTPETIAAAIKENENTKLTTRNFQEVCDLLGFVPQILRPEIFGTVTPLYDVTLMPGRIPFRVLYEAENQNNNIVFNIDYFEDMEDLYVSFEQSQVGTFCSIEGKSVYISPNLNRTNYCWEDGLAIYKISGPLPEETMLPLLEAFLAGDVYIP